MKRFNVVAILSLCLMGYTQAVTVDQSDCEWVWGWYGVEASCSASYIATCACVGGANLDCQGQYAAGLKCCHIDYVYSTCGSGGVADCGGSFTTLTCCSNTAIVLTDDCRWTYGSWGAEMTCDGILTGRCGSGQDKDCPNDSSHGIRCCFIY